MVATIEGRSATNDWGFAERLEPPESGAWGVERAVPLAGSGIRGGLEGVGRLQRRAASVSRAVGEAARADGAYLVPLRLFIGLGWLRAFAEKAAEPGWRDGSSLTAFLLGQLEGGRVAFPAYEALVVQAFLPHAAALGWVVMVGQLLAGVAILCGALTNAALLGGMFMNANFVLAGVPDPSAFYVVIQAVLLLAAAGAVAGMDARLGSGLRHPLLAARPASAPLDGRVGRPVFAGAALLALTVAAYALAHVTDWSPAGSVHDPAVIVAVLAGLAAAWAGLAYLRAADRPDGP